MVDRISKIQRSENMRRIKGKDTKPEMVVRRMVYQMGYRYRVHRKDLPGKPDLAFIGKRKAIFVHGCFWHSHDADHCRDGRIPKSNTDYWNPKLTRNKQRDAENISMLKAAGWSVLVIWACETKPSHDLRIKLEEFLNSGD